MSRRKSVITPALLREVFSRWEAGTALKHEAAELHIGERKLTALLEAMDPQRCARIREANLKARVARWREKRGKRDQKPQPSPFFQSGSKKDADAAKRWADLRQEVEDETHYRRMEDFSDAELQGLAVKVAGWVRTGQCGAKPYRGIGALEDRE